MLRLSFNNNPSLKVNKTKELIIDLRNGKLEDEGHGTDGEDRCRVLKLEKDLNTGIII